jgi:hypothetical protein
MTGARAEALRMPDPDEVAREKFAPRTVAVERTFT